MIGGDLAGVIASSGQVTGSVGQRVFGSHAGRVRQPAPTCLRRAVGDGAASSSVGAATLPAPHTDGPPGLRLGTIAPRRPVLIHAASGGVGITAIQLAPPRRDGLRHRERPQAGHAAPDGCGVRLRLSRTTDFADQILADTGGEGVDVVLNSLTSGLHRGDGAGDRGRRFAEIAKRDIWTAEQMAAVRPDINREIVALDVTMMTDWYIKTLMDELSEGMARGGGRRFRPRSIR